MAKRVYLTTQHDIEDALIEEKEVVCLDSYAYGLTLSTALVRVTNNLPVRAKVVKGWEEEKTPVLPAKKKVRRG